MESEDRELVFWLLVFLAVGVWAISGTLPPKMDPPKAIVVEVVDSAAGSGVVVRSTVRLSDLETVKVECSRWFWNNCRLLEPGTYLGERKDRTHLILDQMEDPGKPALWEIVGYAAGSEGNSAPGPPSAPTPPLKNPFPSPH